MKKERVGQKFPFDQSTDEIGTEDWTKGRHPTIVNGVPPLFCSSGTFVKDTLPQRDPDPAMAEGHTHPHVNTLLLCVERSSLRGSERRRRCYCSHRMNSECHRSTSVRCGDFLKGGTCGGLDQTADHCFPLAAALRGVCNIGGPCPIKATPMPNQSNLNIAYT